MYTLMYIQMSKFLVCSITHITGIWTFQIMYPLVLFHNALLTKCSTDGSLSKSKKEAILLYSEELENITKRELQISYTSIPSKNVFLPNYIKHHKSTMVCLQYMNQIPVT